MERAADQGQDRVDVMSALKTDAMTAHWEFTLGAERVKELADKVPFAFLAQNVRDSEWQEPAFEPRKMFERGGARSLEPNEVYAIVAYLMFINDIVKEDSVLSKECGREAAETQPGSMTMTARRSRSSSGIRSPA